MVDDTGGDTPGDGSREEGEGMGEGLTSRAATAMEHAAEMLETGELEWVQNTLNTYRRDTSGRPTGEVLGACLLGSIYHAIRKLYGAPWLAHIYRHATPALIKVIGHQLPFRWNDRPERVKEEVVDALKTAAKDLRNSANPS